MNKMILVSKILYSLALAFFFGYLINQNSALMACGGVFLIAGGIVLICAKRKNKNTNN